MINYLDQGPEPTPEICGCGGLYHEKCKQEDPEEPEEDESKNSK